MKVMVNGFACDGHTQCVGRAPEMFRLGTDNKAYVVSNTVPPGLEQDVREAALFCPMRAIMVLEEPK
jgi:ferredoxin